MATADIGGEGGMKAILDAMRAFTDSANLNSVCCSALWGLLVNGNIYSIRLLLKLN